MNTMTKRVTTLFKRAGLWTGVQLNGTGHIARIGHRMHSSCVRPNRAGRTLRREDFQRQFDENLRKGGGSYGGLQPGFLGNFN